MTHLARSIAVLVVCGIMMPSSGCRSPALRHDPVGETGFSLDCDQTPNRPCRTLIARDQGKRIELEPSGVVWSEKFGKAIVVSDNCNELADSDVSHFAISSFDPYSTSEEIEVTPLLSPEQARALPLYDLESVALIGERLYVMSSLSLHAVDPDRDIWLRTQFVQMDLVERDGRLLAVGLSHVSERWPDFRKWLISHSGYPFKSAEIQGRAEGIGINVEALSETDDGTLLIGFRGPAAQGGGALAFEIRTPTTPSDEPVLVASHTIRPISSTVPKTLRGMDRVRGQPREFYVLLGPLGSAKEPSVLARWNIETGEMLGTTELPRGIVAEGVAQIDAKHLLIIDDVGAAVMIATQQ